MIGIVNIKLELEAPEPARHSQEPVSNLFLFYNWTSCTFKLCSLLLVPTNNLGAVAVVIIW
jgi:hypothetical protein